MRLARARLGGEVVLARIEDTVATVLAKESRHPAADVLREAIADGVDLSGGGERVDLHAMELAAPVVNPAKFVCVGLNYADHAAESEMVLPKTPVLFSKFSNAIADPDASIVFRLRDAQQVDYEAELVAVMGRRARDVQHNDALQYVLGYTLCNDVSARDAQFADGQWLRGKSFDSFAPLGPWIVTADEIPDVQALRLRASVNGETLQDGNTQDMIFSVAELVSYVSRFMTLEAGDLIATGTPDGVGFARQPPIFLQAGDEVVIEADEIGALRNSVTVLD